jgi:hypothetical protein
MMGYRIAQGVRPHPQLPTIRLASIAEVNGAMSMGDVAEANAYLDAVEREVKRHGD